MLKKIFTTNLIAIPIVIIFIIAFGVYLLISSKKMNNLEKVKITEEGKKVVYNIDEIVERDYSEESYVMFALEYLKQSKDTNTFTLYEVRDVLTTLFDNAITEDKIVALGITPYMVERGVSFDSSSMSYTYSKTYTRTDISAMPIVKYEINKITKKNKNKYEIVYDKYKVTQPYNIYNYYISNSNDQEKVNIISEYLKGTGNSNKVKDLINNDNIDKMGDREGQIKITYTVKDGSLKVVKVDKIKK